MLILRKYICEVFNMLKKIRKPILTGGRRFQVQDHAWSILRSAYSYDSRWNNEESLKKQFFCHVRYGSLKTPWNIEPWKKSTNFITCN